MTLKSWTTKIVAIDGSVKLNGFFFFNIFTKNALHEVEINKRKNERMWERNQLLTSEQDF